jgi:hypothetical protein
VAVTFEVGVACCRSLRTELLRTAVAVEDLERRHKTADKWRDLPDGWDAKSRKKFWNSLTKGEPEHKITECMEKMKGKVDDPGAFCGGLAARVGYR